MPRTFLVKKHMLMNCEQPEAFFWGKTSDFPFPVDEGVLQSGKNIKFVLIETFSYLKQFLKSNFRYISLKGLN